MTSKTFIFSPGQDRPNYLKHESQNLTFSKTLKTEIQEKQIKLQKLAISLDWRLNTFKEPFPYPIKTKRLNGTSLAKAGFIRGSLLMDSISDSTNFEILIDGEDDDTVFCPFCFKHLADFDGDEVPFTEHKNHRADCSFILNVKSKNSKQSLWIDPANVKLNTKNKNPITIGTIWKMQDAVSVAHEKTISSHVIREMNGDCDDQSLDDSSIENSGLKMKLSKMTDNKVRLIKQSSKMEQMLELANKKLDDLDNDINLLTQDYKEPETHNFEELDLHSFSDLYFSYKTFEKSIEQKSKEKSQGTSIGNSSLRKNVLKETFNKRNREFGLTPNSSGLNYSSCNTSENPDATISLSANDVSICQAADIKPAATVGMHKIVQSPNVAKLGEQKTLYIVQADGRFLPIKITVDKHNINELRRQQKMAMIGGQKF